MASKDTDFTPFTAHTPSTTLTLAPPPGHVLTVTKYLSPGVTGRRNNEFNSLSDDSTLETDAGKNNQKICYAKFKKLLPQFKIL